MTQAKKKKKSQKHSTCASECTGEKDAKGSVWQQDTVVRGVIPLTSVSLLRQELLSKGAVALAILTWFHYQTASGHLLSVFSFHQENVVWLLWRRLVVIPNGHHGGECLESQGI